MRPDCGLIPALEPEVRELPGDERMVRGCVKLGRFGRVQMFQYLLGS